MKIWMLEWNAPECDPFVVPCATSTRAHKELSKFVEEEWDSGACDSEFEDHPIDEDGVPREAVQLFFECVPGYEYHIWPAKIQGTVDNAEAAPEIQLTPGMCAVISRALGGLVFHRAAEALADHGELDPEINDQPAKVINRLIEQFGG